MVKNWEWLHFRYILNPWFIFRRRFKFEKRKFINPVFFTITFVVLNKGDENDNKYTKNDGSTFIILKPWFIFYGVFFKGGAKMLKLFEKIFQKEYINPYINKSIKFDFDICSNL